MKYVFIGLVFAGLIFAVRIMLYGVERQRAAGDASPRTFSMVPALLASFSLVAGIAGYISIRAGSTSLIATLTAFASGAIAAASAARLVSKWWAVVPEHDVDDERYVLQGSLGRVIREVTASTPGEISLESSGHKDRIPAKAVEDQHIAPGTEVVIERIENGVAYVEDWATVEKRL